MRIPNFAHIALLIFTLAFASGDALACGMDTTQPNQNSCCSSEQATESETNSCCADADTATGCDSERSDKRCGSDEGNCCGKCHCPHGCTSGSAVCAINIPQHNFTAPPSGDLHSQRQAFYFADHLPEAVYLPIWQPPQIAA